MRRRSSQIVFLVTALLCGGVARGASPVVVPNLTPSEFVDTEIVTNVPFCAGTAHDREFILSIALAASASNSVSVSLGVDADANGTLDRTEADLVVGWDCAGWFYRDRRAGTECRESREPVSRRLDWRLALTSERTPFRLAANDGRTAIFGNAVSPALFNPQWNLLRVTARGPDPAASQVRVQVPSTGLSLRMR